ncbi:MAG: hypothetical protein ACOCX0_05410 [Bacteroidota bacterium]
MVYNPEQCNTYEPQRNEVIQPLISDSSVFWFDMKGIHNETFM